jgi:hypothetical protein
VALFDLLPGRADAEHEVAASAWDDPWDTRTVANGAHTIVAKARDAAGNWGTSSPISVTVRN